MLWIYEIKKKACIFIFLVVEFCCFVVGSVGIGMKQVEIMFFPYYFFGIITNSWRIVCELGVLMTNY